MGRKLKPEELGTGTINAEISVLPSNLQITDTPSGAKDAVNKSYVDGVISSIAVTEGKLADGAVTEGKLAADSVTSAKIAAGAVGASELANSVTLEAGTWDFATNGATLKVKDPVASTDAVNKQYVDNIATGLDPKESCRVATTAIPGNISLSGEQTIDGVSVVAGDRVLVKDQDTASDNGIYVVDSGAWTRSDDFNGDPANEISGGSFTFVELGSTNASTGWVVAADGIVTLGEDPINWVQFSGSGTYTDGSGIDISGTIISVADLGVTEGKIANGAVTAAKIANDVAGAGMVQNGTSGALDVTAADASITVAAGGISVGTISTSHISDITLNTVAAGEVLVWMGTAFENKPLQGDVALNGTNLEIQADAVGTTEIADGAVTTAKIGIDADLAMGGNKLTGLADGSAAADSVNKSQLDKAVTRSATYTITEADDDVTNNYFILTAANEIDESSLLISIVGGADQVGAHQDASNYDYALDDTDLNKILISGFGDGANSIVEGDKLLIQWSEKFSA